MPLTAGTRLGSYEILALIGAGGMGEVYRARDTTLSRVVALKILPQAWASDAERIARFKREATLLATLNHPHIAQIYGFEGSALVMELVDGEDLAARLKRGAIALEEALPIATQIADALQAAHEQGIVHRDLKPANIKVRHDGTVKVLDFGLAKATESTSLALSDSRNNGVEGPTITSPAMTARGVILGTAAYMAPEQAKGKAVDKRADIWAFGCVLYEMLTGRRPFDGHDTSDMLASVLKSEPDWTALPADTPAPIARLLRRCLTKDRARRLADIADARIEIDDARAGDIGDPIARAGRRARLWPAITAAVAVTAVIAVSLGLLAGLRFAPAASPAVARMSLILPLGQQMIASSRGVAISPDGAHIVYATREGLFVRSLATFESRAIPSTAGAGTALSPAFSPGGDTIAVITSDGQIKAFPLSGGEGTTIGSWKNIDTGGILPTVSWFNDGVLLGAGRAGIVRFPLAGGSPETLIRVADDERAVTPQMLPDGEHVLFTALAASPGELRSSSARAQVVVQSIKSADRRLIVERGREARYVRTGHIVYWSDGVLFAVPFDVDRLITTGEPIRVVEGIRAANLINSTVQYAISANGTLVYLPGPVSATGLMNLVLVDRKGVVETLHVPPANYEAVRLSPDGTRLAVSTDDAREAHVWIYDLAGTTSIRQLTFEGRNRFPVWSGDGTRVAFQSNRTGDAAIFWQPADGSRTAEPLTKPEPGSSHLPESWSPSGSHLLFTVTKDGLVTLWTLALRDRRMQPLGGVSSAMPTGAVFSPDGRWVAYTVSDLSGPRSTVFVQPFPPTGAMYQVSRDFGHHPIWSRDGAELFYVPGAGRLTAVKVTTSPAFSVGTPSPLSAVGNMGPPTMPRNHDITPDGKRFIGRMAAESDESGPLAATRIHVVLNWFEELKAHRP